MRALVVAVLLLASPGLAPYQAAAAAFEKPGEPGRVPVVIPKVEIAPANPGLPGAPAGAPEPPSLPQLDAAAALPVPGVEAAAAGAALEPPRAGAAQGEAPLDAPRTPEPLAEGLRVQQERLERALAVPGASDERASAEAAVFTGESRPRAAIDGDAAAAPTAWRRFWSRAGRRLSVPQLVVQARVHTLLDHGARLERRVAAARRLGELNSRETLEALGETASCDAAPEVRAAAREALLAGAPRWIAVLLKELRLHPLGGRRASAARALGWIARASHDSGAPAPSEIVDGLGRQASVDLSHDVRLTAIQALSRSRSAKALATLANIRRLATKPDIISAAEVAVHEAIAARQAEGLTVAPYARAAPPAEFGSSKQPLYAQALKRVIGVSAVFTAIEFVGGLIIGSLSLKADSMHLLADLGINVGALFALWMSRRPPNSHKTYGYLKMESLTGLLSAVAIAGMAAFTLFEAVPRLWAPVAVPGLATIALALSGLLSNAISTVLLYRYQNDNLSLKGAFLHAATDAVGSLGIIAAGALIYFFHWFVADPIISFLIVALILHTTWDLAKRSWNVLIDAVPPGVEIEDLEGDLLAVPGVVGVYDLHVWSLNSSERALTAVLYVKPGASLERALAAAKAVVRERHGIGHATLQVESLKPPSI